MKSHAKLLALPILLLASGCGALSADAPAPAAPARPAVADAAAVADTPVRLGDAYTIGGQRHVPVDQADYDEVGYASWYGNELAGRPTANGENFQPEWVSAAHRTLPMPSYVEVSRLDTGATILVRVNDRGPADSRRLIDLSAGAARQLGLTEAGVVGVRVRRVNPVEAERLMLRSGRPVPIRLSTADSLLPILRERLARLPTPGGVMPQPAAAASPRPATSQRRAPRATPAPAVTNTPDPAPAASPPAAATGGFVVQYGAFSSRARADELARRLSATVVTAGNVHRVRSGPYPTEAAAQAALAASRRRGHPGGVVVRGQ